MSFLKSENHKTEEDFYLINFGDKWKFTSFQYQTNEEATGTQNIWGKT